MKRASRALTLAAASLIAAGVLLAGCGGSGTPAPGPSGDVTGAPVTPAAEETATATPEPPGPPTVTVPDVVGMLPEDAAVVLLEAGLEAEALDLAATDDEDAYAVAAGRVYRQTPAAGSAVPAGTSVELRSWGGPT